MCHARSASRMKWRRPILHLSFGNLFVRFCVHCEFINSLGFLVSTFVQVESFGHQSADDREHSEVRDVFDTHVGL